MVHSTIATIATSLHTLEDLIYASSGFRGSDKYVSLTSVGRQVLTVDAGKITEWAHNCYAVCGSWICATKDLSDISYYSQNLSWRKRHKWWDAETEKSPLETGELDARLCLLRHLSFSPSLVLQLPAWNSWVWESITGISCHVDSHVSE